MGAVCACCATGGCQCPGVGGTTTAPPEHRCIQCGGDTSVCNGHGLALGVHLHVDSEQIGKKQLAQKRPFVLSLPVFESVYGVKDASGPTRKVVDVSSGEDLLDVVELASSCVVNATRKDATPLDAIPHTAKIEAYLSSAS
jgi:hypothetical protein